MNYKGYTAHLAYSDADELFVGHVANIDHVVGFHGVSVSTLNVAFRQAVDDYLQTCERLGREPQSPAQQTD